MTLRSMAMAIVAAMTLSAGCSETDQLSRREQDNNPTTNNNTTGSPDDDVVAMPDDPEDEPCTGTTLQPSSDELANDITHPVFEAEAITPGLGYRFGQGPLQRCVDGMTLTTDVTNEETELSTKTTAEARSTALRINAAASVSVGVVSASAGVGLATNQRFSRHDLIIAIQVSVTTRSETYESGIRLIDEVADLAATNPVQFLATCGDRYISSVTRGGELLILLTISTQSEEDRSALETSLSASYAGTGSIDVDVARELQQTLSERRVDLNITRIGGGARPAPSNPTDIAALFEYASAFGGDVRRAPVVISYKTRPYARLPNPVVCEPNYNQATLDLIGEAWERLLEVSDLLESYRDAIANPERFICRVSSNETRRAQVEDIQTYKEDLESALTGCAQRVTEEDHTTGPCAELGLIMANANLPPELHRWTFLKAFEVNFDAERGQQDYYFELPSEVCGPPTVSGSWSAWENNADCEGPCFEDCPVPTQEGTRLHFRIWDWQPENNRGRCEMQVSCMDPLDAYLLDQCEDG